MQLFVRADRTLCVDVEPLFTVLELKQALQQRTGINVSEQRLVCGGRPLQHNTTTLAAAGVRPLATLQLLGRLRGGKGGFGALLRAGARSSRNENVDACRDLSGRRLRHVNADKKLREWAAGAKERELEKIALQHIKAETKAAERAARAEVDVDAAKREHQEGMASVREAIGSAVAALPGGTKRDAAAVAAGPAAAAGAVPKRARLFADAVDDGCSSSDDSSDDEGTAPATAAEATTAAGEGATASGGATLAGKEAAGRSDSGESAATGPAGQSSPSDSPTSAAAAAAAATGGAEEKAGVAKLPPVPVAGEADIAAGSPPSPAAAPEPIVLGQYESAEALQAAGMARLAATLAQHGLKAGGSLSERAARLFLLRSTPLAELDRKHFAKPAGKGGAKGGAKGEPMGNVKPGLKA
mmetsp:Transcript_13135/g.39736  ORF Transcript_13135/g.39736 Transcript_13135/m.39736 type:complete len:413 (-) Transcript_13135:241-1479(-)